MKILCVPDLHCFYDGHSRPSEDGTSSRLADWKRTVDALIALAVREKVDLAVVPGDYVVMGRYPARVVLAVLELFRGLTISKIPVIGCKGNHDETGPGQPGPVDLLAAHNPNWGITAPRIVRVPGLQVAVLPWAKPSSLVAQSEGAGDVITRTSEVLITIVRSLAAQVNPDEPAVLVGHWAVEGCVLSSGNTLAGGEPALPLSELQVGPWRAVILGHIHRPQVFQGRPTVLHTGALERRDFGEERDERGCYIVDTETGEATWYELPARRFWTLHLGSAQVDRLAAGIPPSDRTVAGPLLEQAKDAICRVVYQATDEQHRQIDQSALIAALEAAGAHHVAGVYPEIVRAERTRADGLTEHTSPLAALDQWLALRSELSDELRADVRQAAADLVGEVA